jgi:replicative DNA helicase
MSKEQLFLRLLAGIARVDSQRIRAGRLSENEYTKLSRAIETLAKARLYIDDQGAITVPEVAVRCRRLAAEQGLDFVLIDYLQLMRSPKGSKHGSREQEIAAISRDLKALAKELRVPIMVLSQLSRAPETRSEHRPIPSDLRESGSLEQDADVILFPYRAEVYTDRERDQDSFEATRDDGVAELIIAKQRNGPIGTVKLAYLKPYVRFESVAHGDPVAEVTSRSFAHA